MDLIYSFINTINNSLDILVKDKKKFRYEDEGRYAYVPSQPNVYIEKFKAIEDLISKKKDIKFLEVGSGIGLVALTFNSIFNNSTILGLEINDELITKSLIPTLKCDCLLFENYKDYDVIYMWRPLLNEKQIELENKIISEMKLGAILVTYDSLSNFPLTYDEKITELQLHPYVSGIYKK